MKLHQKQLPLLFITCISAGMINAQGIKIGEHCPDVKLNHVINAQVTELNISNYNGKLVILDFWGTGCTACIQAFSEIDSLQKKFGGKVQFIAVNTESKDSTLRFFKRMRRIKLPHIPFVTGDTILSEFFPHAYVPHHVWIDSNRVVRFITDGYNATDKHISDFVEGKQVELEEKKFESNSFFNRPMESLASGEYLDKVESYSLLIHYISGVTFPCEVKSTIENGHVNLVSQCNASIVQLFTTAYSEGGKYDFSADNTIIPEVKDKYKLNFPKDNNLLDEWSKKYCYNYEFMVNPKQSSHFYKFMQKDLTRYFNLKGVIEKRMVNCLVLVRTAPQDKLTTKGGKPATNFWSFTNDSLVYMNNMPFEGLVSALNVGCKYHALTTPFFDETNYHGNIDIEISKDALDDLDISELQRELNKYGLGLIIKKRLVDALVLRDLK